MLPFPINELDVKNNAQNSKKYSEKLCFSWPPDSTGLYQFQKFLLSNFLLWNEHIYGIYHAYFTPNTNSFLIAAPVTNLFI